MIAQHISETIGHTPLLKLPQHVTGLKHINIYAKLEYMNPFGSIKDRTAWGMMKDHLSDISANHKTIIEASSGNTAKALAALGGTYGVPLHVITNRIRYPEGRHVLQTLGVDIEELPSLGECPDPFAPNDAMQYTKRLTEQNPGQYFYPEQYYNPKNPQAHYDTTGKEIADDLGQVDYFFGFLGTCGTTLGTGSYLKSTHADTHIYGVISAAGHVIPGGRNANELWEVGLFKQQHYQAILQADTQQAIQGMLTLNRQCGVLCGPTGGATFVAACQKLQEIDAVLAQNPPQTPHTAVFIACDRMEAYMGYLKQHKPELFSTKPPKYRTLASLTDDEIASVPTLQPAEVDAFVGQGALLIDTRGSFSFSVEHIKGSLNFSEDIMAHMLESDSQPFPQGQRLVLMCRVGVVSQRFAALLRLKGCDARSLAGGLTHYQNTGLPLQSGI